MKKILFFILMLISVLGYSLETSFVFGIASGLGASGTGDVSFETGGSFGIDYFNTINAFEDDVYEPIQMNVAKRMNLTIGWEIKKRLIFCFQ